MSLCDRASCGYVAPCASTTGCGPGLAGRSRELRIVRVDRRTQDSCATCVSSFGCHPPASWDQVEVFPAMSMGPPERLGCCADTGESLDRRYSASQAQPRSMSARLCRTLLGSRRAGTGDGFPRFLTRWLALKNFLVTGLRPWMSADVGALCRLGATVGARACKTAGHRHLQGHPLQAQPDTEGIETD
jgi:hypothetical protein